MIEKEYMMKVFPTLEEYWDRDGGLVFNDAYDFFQRSKDVMYYNWNEVKQGKEPEYPFVAFDIESFCIRLVPEYEDPRPYATEEDMEEWEILSEKALGKGIYLGRENYLRTMEKMNAYKLSDERNCSIMEAHLIVSFELEKILEDTYFL